MSIYPNGLHAAWMPHSVVVKIPKTRDIHNEVTAWTRSRKRPAKIKRQPVELLEAGVRTLRDGVKAEIGEHADYPLEVGTIFEWRDVDYTVIQIESRADHRGLFHFATCYAVAKRGET